MQVFSEKNKTFKDYFEDSDQEAIQVRDLTNWVYNNYSFIDLSYVDIL